MKPLLRLGGSRKAYALVWPLTTDLPDKLSGIFLQEGLDRLCTDLPVRSFLFTTAPRFVDRWRLPITGLTSIPPLVVSRVEGLQFVVRSR